jgi:NAD(P)-dependent dehydrogenase (short-subunit alcohol dehydrogenase family)
MKKVAIITGASRGIGAETAKELAAQGYAVCVNYFQASEHAEKVVADIQNKQGEAIAIKADIAKEEDILYLFAEVDKKLGPLTALINNAGINGGFNVVEDISLACLEKVFATNVFGTFLCCREAVKRMKNHGGGSIVNVTSEAAKFGGNKLAHYAASKAALNTFTMGFAREVANDNIRVNAVSPGVIETDQHKNASAERLTTLLKSLPMGRMGTTKEVANLICWLVSDASSYVSGAIIPISGSR